MADVHIEAANAKINLALHVTGRRADGYHTLQSMVVFAELADELQAIPAAADRLSVQGPFAAGLGPSRSNLVMKAVAGFRQRWPDLCPRGLDVRLTKNLPVMAGLGGGSADAAATLRLLLAIAGVDVDRAELNDLAVSLGADVPACLLSRPCLVAGIGETVTPLRDFPASFVVLVNPMRPVVTADVFRRLDRHAFAPLPELPESLDRTAMLAMWLEDTRNDLQSAALGLVPEIGDIEARLRRAPGCVFSRMSGSGATVFGLFGSGQLAHLAAQELRREWPDFWIAAAPLVAA
ncbi:MAG TPA: 4-(cytidine 5'-diphospho)-2-C-methyl-D-erythritol kinase [Devosiaceae bacterium]